MLTVKLLPNKHHTATQGLFALCSEGPDSHEDSGSYNHCAVNDRIASASMSSRFAASLGTEGELTKPCPCSVTPCTMGSGKYASHPD